MDIKTVIILLFIIIISFLLGRTSKKTIIDTITSEETIIDTFYTEPIIDTLYIINYKERYLKVVDTLNIRDTIPSTDTVLVYVPISKYVFTDSLYKIEASGYDVTIDNVELYRKTIYKTEVNNIKTNSKWGLGIQLGYGICNNKVSPYIGMGVQYNILNF